LRERQRSGTAPLAGTTFHAAMALFDQQSPHNSSGTTITSAALPHPGHTRTGERNSTSPAAFINCINLRTDIANAIVLRFHTSADTMLRIFLSLLLGRTLLCTSRAVA